MPQGVKLAVADLTYRGGTDLVFGKKADGTDFNGTKHLKDGNFGAFLGEVLHGSNAEGFAGNYRRNLAMVDQALEHMSEGQRKTAISKLKTWEQEHPDAVRRTRELVQKYNKNPRTPEGSQITLDEFYEKRFGQKPSGGSTDNTTSIPAADSNNGSPVHVDAHTRGGHAVRAHTRGAPD